MYLALMVWAWIRIVSGPDLSQYKQNALFWEKNNNKNTNLLFLPWPLPFRQVMVLVPPQSFIDSLIHSFTSNYKGQEQTCLRSDQILPSLSSEPKGLTELVWK